MTHEAFSGSAAAVAAEHDSKPKKSCSSLVLHMEDGQLKVDLVLDEADKTSYPNMLAIGLAFSLQNREWCERVVDAVVKKIWHTDKLLE